jgi:hypothetical protein
MEQTEWQSTQQLNDGKVVGHRPWSRRLRDIPNCDGLKSELCPGYSPTRQELEQLVRYWQWELIDLAFYCFTDDRGGSTELEIAKLCVSKIDALELVLGKESVAEIRDECAEDFRRFVGTEAWEVYLNQIRKAVNEQA